MALDKKREGAPGFYRARTWPYKGRRRLVRIYKEDGTVVDVEGGSH